MAELLKRLSVSFGVSGSEHSVRNLIIGEIKDKTDDITIDSMGNIIAFKRGKKRGRAIAVTANMDEVGLIISEITDKGYLKFKLVGDIDPRKLVSKRVVTENGVHGVLGMKAIHLQTRSERDEVKKAKDLYIDIGAKNKDEAAKRVRLGEYVTFDTEFSELEENVKGKALERSGACYSLINALDGEYPYDFYAVFTAQHEVGARGAMIAAHRVNADAVLVITGMETADMYDCKIGGIKLGGGAVISYADKSVIADRALTEGFIALAGENGIRIQSNVTRPYSSDGGAMQITDSKIISAVIPCRYAKSPVSIMNMGDIAETEKLIKLYLNKIGEML